MASMMTYLSSHSTWLEGLRRSLPRQRRLRRSLHLNSDACVAQITEGDEDGISSHSIDITTKSSH
jgi:hypothetical protein